jgi:hypothetical protein
MRYTRLFSIVPLEMLEENEVNDAELAKITQVIEEQLVIRKKGSSAGQISLRSQNTGTNSKGVPSVIRSSV